MTASMQEKYEKYLVLMEQQLQCSGMCSSVPFYEFTSTSAGIPTASCAEALTKAVEENAGPVAGWCLAFSGVAFMSVLTSVAIFYIERRHFIPENYSRYTDWGLK